MHKVKQIREMLGETQAELAVAMKCTPGNVGHYERGQTLMPDVAILLVEHAAARGMPITLDQVYGLHPLPELAKEGADA